MNSWGHQEADGVLAKKSLQNYPEASTAIKSLRDIYSFAQVQKRKGNRGLINNPALKHRGVGLWKSCAFGDTYGDGWDA